MKKDYKNILLIVLFVFTLGISINVHALDCNGVLNPDFIKSMKDYVYVPIKWATPILLLLLTSMDFAKVVFAGKTEEMDKAKNNFMKRFVAALIIFFAPDLIILIVDLTSADGIGSIKACLEQF